MGMPIGVFSGFHSFVERIGLTGRLKWWDNWARVADYQPDSSPGSCDES